MRKGRVFTITRWAKPCGRCQDFRRPVWTGQDCLFPPLRRWPLPADYCFPRVGSRPDGDLFPGTWLAAGPTPPIVPIVPIVNDIVARFSGEIAGNTLFLQTNWNAPRGKILAVDLTRPARSNWREVVPESDAVLEDFSLAGGRIFAAYLENVRTRVKIFEPNGSEAGELELPDLGSASGIRADGRVRKLSSASILSTFRPPFTAMTFAKRHARSGPGSRCRSRVKS